MEFKNNGKQVLIRLDDGDEVVASLKEVCRREGIGSALVSGIGAAKRAEIAHYDTKEKRYNTIKLEGMLEIVSLSGNMARLEGEAVAHLHIAISRHDFSTLSGHLMKAEICPNCEIVLIPLGSEIERKFDERTGLNLQHY